MRAAIYARVSTTDQTCDLQLRELRDYIQRRGWDAAGEYVDTGFSGTKKSRPALDRLMRDARSRKVDCILVWKLDRWGRSLAHCLQMINELRSLRVRWIAVTQNLDTDESNPMSHLMLHIMAAFAEFEREMIRERTRSGVAVAKSQGKHCGRPKKVFRRDEARRLHAQGMSLRDIGQAMGVSFMTVRRAIADLKTQKAVAP